MISYKNNFLKFLSFVVAVQVIAFESSADIDSSDAKVEKKLHQKYLKYGSTPTSNDQWSQATSKGKSETYLVQKGDNLWEISQTFFADPEFWPKIWSLNKNTIFNPHEIEPQDTLYFVPGTLAEPPQVLTEVGTNSITSNSTSIKNTASARPSVVNQNLDQVRIPLGKSRPVALVPGSLPNWQMSTGSTVGEIDLQVRRKNLATQEYPILGLIIEVNKNNDQELAEVAEAQDVMTYVGSDPIILIKNNRLSVGSKALVVKELGEISSNPKVSNSENIVGKTYSVEAEVTILAESVEGMQKARVNKSFAPIVSGASLISGQVETFHPTSGGESAAGLESSAKVVGGAEGGTREIFGQGELLFLDQGSNQGLQIGQNLKLYHQFQFQDSKHRLPQPSYSGTVQIVRLTANFATAFVIKAPQEIRVGDSATSTAVKQNIE